jgi:hypothetical protein
MSVLIILLHVVVLLTAASDTSWDLWLRALEPDSDCASLVSGDSNKTWYSLSDETKTDVVRCVVASNHFKWADGKCGALLGYHAPKPVPEWSALGLRKQEAITRCLAERGYVRELVTQHPFLRDWFPLDVFHREASQIAVLTQLWAYYLVTQQYQHDRQNGLAGTPSAVIKQWAALGLCTKHYYNERTGATKGYLPEDQVEYTLDDYMEWNNLLLMNRLVGSEEWAALAEQQHVAPLMSGLWKQLIRDFVMVSSLRE